MNELIEQLKYEYQKKLNDSYRKENKNNGMLSMLSEEEIAILNPLTDEMFLKMITYEQIEILSIKADYRKQIELAKAELNDPSTRSDEKSELSNDIFSANFQLSRLDTRLSILNEAYNFLKKDENRESTSPSR